MIKSARRFSVTAIALFTALLAIDASVAEATHLRFGTITWTKVLTHLPVTQQRYNVTVQIGVRWSFPFGGPANRCPSVPGWVAPVPASTYGAGSCMVEGSTISLGSIVSNVSATWHGPGLPTSGITTTSIPLNAIYTVVQPSTDTAYATASFTVTVPTGTSPIISYQASARLSTLRDGNADQQFRIQTMLDSRPFFTRSPEVVSMPIINVTTNVLNEVFLPSVAFDNMTNRFRFSEVPESLLVTTRPAGMSLATDTPGLVRFTPQADGLYAVQFMVTGYDEQGQPGATVPLDMLFLAGPPTGVSASLNTPLTTQFFVPGQTSSFALTSTLQPPTAGYTATINRSQLPQGATFSQPACTGQAACTATVSWNPTINSQNSVVCFQATYTRTSDMRTTQSQQLCVSMLLSAFATTMQAFPATAVAGGGPLTLSARLTRTIDGTPIAGRPVTFHFPSDPLNPPWYGNTTAITDATGLATVTGLFASRPMPGGAAYEARFSAVANEFLQSSALSNVAIVSGASGVLSSAPIANPQPSVGFPLTVSATLGRLLTPADGGVFASPGENVRFTLNGVETAFGTTVVGGVATATFANPLPAAGATHTVVAYFDGSASLAPAAAPSPTATFTVRQRLKLTLQPLVGPVAQPVTIRATLTNHPQGTPLAGRTVQFQFPGGSPSSATATTNGNGEVAVTTSYATAQNFTVTASTALTSTELDDAGLLAASETDTTTATIGGTGLPTTLTLPAVAAISGVTTMTTATLRATATSLPVAGATVTFSIPGGATLGTAQTDLLGEATLTWIPGAAAAGQIRADFAGTAAHFMSSATAPLTISLAPTQLTPLAVSPALVGGSLTVSTTLSRTVPAAAAIAGVPITFTLAGPAGSPTVQTIAATTDASGTASVSFPSLTQRGAFAVSASFAATPMLASTSQSGNVDVYQRTALTLQNASGQAGAPTSLTATLTAIPGGAAISGQTVAFSCDGSPVNGAATTGATGAASFATTFALGGSFTCSASFFNLAGYFVDATGSPAPSTGTATASITAALSQLSLPGVTGVPIVGQPFTATTTLTSGAMPIGDAPVTCTLTGPAGAISTTSTTTAAGEATCSFTPSVRGVHTLSASFAGTGGVQPSTSASAPVTVYQRVNLVLSSATGSAGATIPVTATLTTEPGNAPLANQRVDFSFAGGPASQFTITDGNGEATVIVQFPNAGNFNADASFANVAGFFANEAGALAAETATASIAITMAATTLSQPILTPTSASTALVGNSLGVSTALSRTSAPAGPLSGAPISFTVTGGGGFTSTLTATTDATGFASVVFPLTQRGQFHIEVAYAGSGALASASRTADFSVYQRTALILNPIFGPAQTDTNITALLTAIPGDAPIAGQQVAISCVATATNSTGTTDASGQATIVGNFANAGSYPCSATFSNLAGHFVDENGQPLPTTAIASAAISQVSVSLSPLTVAPTQFTGTTLPLTTVLSRVTAPSGVIAGRQVTFTIAGPGGVMTTLAATTDTNGIASAAPQLTIRGPYSVTATFAGDAALSPESTSAPFTVYQRAAIDVAPVSGAAGTPITITATLIGTPEGAPIDSQSVLFSFGGAAADQTAQTNAAGVASVTATFTNAGNVTATASFANAANHFANRNGVVGPDTDSATVTVTAAATTLTALTAPPTAIAGTTLSVSALLSRVDGTPIPAGRPVEFTVTLGGNIVQTVTGLTDASGLASASVTVSDRGPHAVSAAFVEADGLLASLAAPATVTVYQRVQMTVPATISAIAGSTVSISGTMTSGGSPVAGQAVSFTFTGTGAPAAQSVTTDSNGVASALVTFDNAGSYAVDASFLNADGFFTNAAGALPPAPETGQGDVTVERAATTLQLQPLNAPIGLVDGNHVVQARLARTDGVAVPAGKPVIFTFTAPSGVMSSLNATTQADGLASVTFTPVERGSFSYSAAFATDAALLAAATTTETVTVYQRVSLAMPATITSIATQPVTISATLTTLPGGAPIANQVISFQFSGGGSLPASQSATTNAAGVASVTVTFPVLGAYTATASFENFAAHFTSPAGDPVPVPVTAASSLDVRNTPPTFTPPANITAEAAAANGATVTFIAIGTDVEDGTIAAQCTPVSGTRFPIGTTTVNCTVTDSAQVSASGAFTVTVRDTTAPSLTIPAPITVPAANNNGATVTFAVSASDAVNGAVTPVCTPASGSLFAIQTTTVSCTATDAAGNAVTKTFTVKVTEVTTPGEMRGNGFINEDGARYKFDFWVKETDRAGERGAFELDIDQKEECDCRDNRNRRVSHNHRDDRHHDCRGRDRDDRFKARSVDFVAFSDDPTIRPGRPRRPQVDTVLFSGIGDWNGRRGYRFEVRATDEGEPGRHREMISITIWDPNGVVVAQVSGDIDGGNIQSTRIDHRGTDRR